MWRRQARRGRGRDGVRRTALARQIGTRASCLLGSLGSLTVPSSREDRPGKADKRRCSWRSLTVQRPLLCFTLERQLFRTIVRAGRRVVLGYSSCLKSVRFLEKPEGKRRLGWCEGRSIETPPASSSLIVSKKSITKPWYVYALLAGSSLQSLIFNYGNGS